MHFKHAPLFKVGSGAGLLVQLCLINLWISVALAESDMETGASFAELNRQKELDMHPSASSFNTAPSSLRGSRSPMMTAERSRSIDDAAYMDFITTAPYNSPKNFITDFIKDFISVPEVMPMEKTTMKVDPGIAIPYSDGSDASLDDSDASEQPVPVSEFTFAEKPTMEADPGNAILSRDNTGRRLRSSSSGHTTLRTILMKQPSSL